MTVNTIIAIAKVVAVIGLLIAASVLAMPKDRLPLALRAIRRICERDGSIRRNSADSGDEARPSAARRLTAFILVVIAAIVAVF